MRRNRNSESRVVPVGITCVMSRSRSTALTRGAATRAVRARTRAACAPPWAASRRVTRAEAVRRAPRGARRPSPRASRRSPSRAPRGSRGGTSWPARASPITSGSAPARAATTGVPGRQRLDRRQAEALEQRGEHHDAGGAVRALELLGGHLPREAHACLEPQAAQRLLERRERRKIVEHAQSHFGRQERERVEEVLEPLVRVSATTDEQELAVRRAARGARRAAAARRRCARRGCGRAARRNPPRSRASRPRLDVSTPARRRATRACERTG